MLPQFLAAVAIRDLLVTNQNRNKHPGPSQARSFQKSQGSSPQLLILLSERMEKSSVATLLDSITGCPVAPSIANELASFSSICSKPRGEDSADVLFLPSFFVLGGAFADDVKLKKATSCLSFSLSFFDPGSQRGSEWKTETSRI